MSAASYPQAITTAVERLLEVWWTMNHTEQSSQLTLDSFQSLARGYSLTRDDAPEAVWVPVKPGNIVRGEYVRVRNEAYKDQVGHIHNGRTGRVVAVRHGDVIVKYDDSRTPQFDGVHHSPHVLEKRVR